MHLPFGSPFLTHFCDGHLVAFFALFFAYDLFSCLVLMSDVGEPGPQVARSTRSRLLCEMKDFVAHQVWFMVSTVANCGVYESCIAEQSYGFDCYDKSCF